MVRARPLAVPVVSMLALGLACGLGSFDLAAYQEAEAEHAAMVAGLHGIHAELAVVDGIETERCPDGAIAAYFDERRALEAVPAMVGSLQTVEHAFLAHLSHGVRSPDDPWSWMRSGWTGGFDGVFLEPEIEDPESTMGRLERSAAAANSRDRIQGMKDERYLGVLVAERASLPLADRDDYLGGVFVGWLVVYDLQGFERLCQVRLRASSNDDVDFSAGVLSSDLQQAVQHDFERKVELAVEDSLRAISEELRAPVLTGF